MSLNNHELKFVAWLKSDKDYWRSIKSTVNSFMEDYYENPVHLDSIGYDPEDECARLLKEEEFYDLDGYNPFDDGFMLFVDLDKVCSFLTNSIISPSYYKKDIERIDYIVDQKSFLNKLDLGLMEVAHG